MTTVFSPIKSGLKKEKTKVLSMIELEYLQLVADGMTYAEIADKYSLSELTIKIIISNICTKLEASGQTEAMITAMKEGLIKV